MPRVRRTSSPAAPPWVFVLAIGGALSALAGGYWDDAWHTERGRDAFFIAPHVAIYAGIAAVGGALAAWAMLVARRSGLSAVWSHKPLVLALVGVAATLVSAPIDNAWHIAFGRDAVIWSPPHMLGIVGTMTLAAALLTEVAGRAEAWARSATVIAGALLLASAGFVVAEYDTDVPQFDTSYYLPALGLAASIALVLVRIAADKAWAATSSAAVHALFMAAVAGFLAAAGFATPALPLLAAAAIVVDVGARRRWSPVLMATWWTAALHVAYVPVRNLLGDGVRFDATDVAASAGLTWMAALVVFAVAADDRWPLRRGRARAYLALVLTLTMAPSALAHDPGQGDDAGTVGMTVVVDDGTARLTAELPGATCRSTDPVAIVARRGGRAVRSGLEKIGCVLSGDVRLDERGRWFVYALMERRGRTVESWLPALSRENTTSVGDAQRYAYFASASSSGVVKTVAGVTLYAAMLVLLAATWLLVRASRRPSYTPSE